MKIVNFNRIELGRFDFFYFNNCVPVHHIFISSVLLYYNIRVLFSPSQLNATKAAEKKFKTTLKRAGLDEEFVTRRGGRSTIDSFDESEDGDRDATYTKSRELIDA